MKTYITPQITLVQLEAEAQLLSASDVLQTKNEVVSTTEYGHGKEGWSSDMWSTMEE